MRQGKDLTLIAFSKMVGYGLTVAETLAKEGIDVEVRAAIRLFCLDPTAAHAHYPVLMPHGVMPHARIPPPSLKVIYLRSILIPLI